MAHHHHHHKPGCSGDWNLVACGSTHIHKCDCGANVRFNLMAYGCCPACDEIHDCQPTFGGSRYGHRRYADDESENAREVLESLAA